MLERLALASLVFVRLFRALACCVLSSRCHGHALAIHLFYDVLHREADVGDLDVKHLLRNRVAALR